MNSGWCCQRCSCGCIYIFTYFPEMRRTHWDFHSEYYTETRSLGDFNEFNYCISTSSSYRSLKAFDNENRFYPNRIGRMHSSEWRDYQLSTIFAPNAFKVLLTILKVGKISKVHTHQNKIGNVWLQTGFKLPNCIEWDHEVSIMFWAVWSQ